MPFGAFLLICGWISFGLPPIVAFVMLGVGFSCCCGGIVFCDPTAEQEAEWEKEEMKRQGEGRSEHGWNGNRGEQEQCE